MLTIATLLSGGEGVGVGAQAAGLRHLWGVEIDDAIAQVARANGFNVITADIREIDPVTLERPDVLHASPECKNASQAKANGRETAEDGEVADCIVRYIETLRPRVFTLENVYPYRHFEAFQRIKTALGRLGYFYHFANLNAADFGVPQTRRRLILRAIHGGLLPMLPAPETWRGWYEAIEDLVPGLPESQFAPWQLKGLPIRLEESLLVDSAGYPDKVRAFLVGGQFGQPASEENEPRPPQVRAFDGPSLTVTASYKGDWRGYIYKGDWRGYIVDGANAKAGRAPTTRPTNELMFTVSATAISKYATRARISSGKVVMMTTRCLARFQSFPDQYELPDTNTLASRIIGNAVPPLMYQKIVAGLARGIAGC